MDMPRIAAGVMGVGATGISAYAATSHAFALEESISYLVVAAGMIAVSVTIIPPAVETLWRRGHRLKAGCWILALVPAATVVFTSAATRVHDANEAARAERISLERAAKRVEQDRDSARERLATAIGQADRYRGLSDKDCNHRCRTARASEIEARAQAVNADTRLTEAEKLLRTASALTAPNWILPVAVDMIGFLGVWTAWSGSRRRPVQPKKIKTKRRRATPADRLHATASDLRTPSLRRLHS